MKNIKYNDFVKMLNFNDYTAFVVSDGTQQMYSGCEINEETIDPFFCSDVIEQYEADELPEIAEIMSDNLECEFRPASGISDEGYDSIMLGLNNKDYYIVKASVENISTYMLVWK